MAHAKTTAFHWFSQIAAGGLIGSVAYFSLRSQPAQPASIASAADQLNAEISSNTTGKLWGLTETSPKSSASSLTAAADQPTPPTHT